MLGLVKDKTTVSWEEDHSLETPWGFSIEDALEAIRFKKMVQEDNSAFNPYAVRKLSVVEQYFPSIACAFDGCWEVRLNKTDTRDLIPKGAPRHGILEGYCRKHFWVLWDDKEQQAEKERNDRQRTKILAERKWALRNLDNHVAYLETKELWAVTRQNKTDYLAERKRKRYNGPPRPGYVYHLYTREKKLLYVGKTVNFENRFYGKSGHATTKDWWPEVFGAMITEFKTEADALLAEPLYIHRGSPVHNIVRPIPKIKRLPSKIAEYYIHTRLT